MDVRLASVFWLFARFIVVESIVYWDPFIGFVTLSIDHSLGCTCVIPVEAKIVLNLVDISPSPNPVVERSLKSGIEGR